MKRKKEGKRSFHQLCATGMRTSCCQGCSPTREASCHGCRRRLMESEAAPASLMILSGKLATPPPAPSAEKKETEESEKNAIFAHERHGGEGNGGRAKAPARLLLCWHL